MSENTALATSLVEQLNAEHRACLAAANDALQHAMRCGDLLIEAKAGVPHGEWQRWLADNFDGSTRSAQVYMRLAGNREVLESKNADSALLSIDGAMRLLASPSNNRLYPPASDNPAEYEDLVERHQTYQANRNEWLNTEFWPVVERIERGENVPLGDCAALLHKSRDIINGLQRWRLKCAALIGDGADENDAAGIDGQKLFGLVFPPGITCYVGTYRELPAIVLDFDGAGAVLTAVGAEPYGEPTFDQWRAIMAALPIIAPGTMEPVKGRRR